MHIKSALVLLISGLLFITMLDVLGARASRKLHFKYGSLVLFSLAIYIGLGFYASKQCSLTIALIINNIVGIYDGTIGFRLSILLKANSDIIKEKGKELLTDKAAALMMVFATICTLFGFLLTKL